MKTGQAEIQGLVAVLLVGWLVMTINLHCELIIVSKDTFQPQVISRLLFLTLEGPWVKMDFPGV